MPYVLGKIVLFLLERDIYSFESARTTLAAAMTSEWSFEKSELWTVPEGSDERLHRRGNFYRVMSLGISVGYFSSLVLSLKYRSLSYFRVRHCP
jgi:hypothetical protein